MTIPPPTPDVILFGERLDELYQRMIVIVPGATFASTNPTTKAIVVTYPAGTLQGLKDQVNTLIAGFDWTQPAQDAWEDQKKPNRAAIKQQAQTAIATNNTFLALGSPTNVQTLAQVQALTQMMTAVIRYLNDLANAT